MLRTTLVAAMAAVIAVGAAGQAPNAKKDWTPPRTADGQPDLGGVWTNATITPLERPADLAGKVFFAPSEVAAYEKQVVENANVDRRRSDITTDVGLAYNEAWWDRGTHIVKTLRTSLIVDPADGKLPPLTADGERRAAAVAEQRRLHPADGPENRALTERCILWPTAGPPMMPSAYNNNYQIFQGPGYVAIEVEMIHDVRIIPLDARPHLPSNVRQWLGDSRGHWEGNTLIVETTNFTHKTRFRGSSENLRLTERFTRTDPDTILYEYTVNDPATWTKPWTVQVTMAKSDSQLYEYACHEGNYGMTGILTGARAEEKNAAMAGAK
ncbi:MAG: hypothetical protein ABI833_00665 [Acidobacteriota bacterium]